MYQWNLFTVDSPNGEKVLNTFVFNKRGYIRESGYNLCICKKTVLMD